MRPPYFPDPTRFTSYHLTFTCYGTWLLGSEKGSTRHGGDYVKPSVRLENYMRDHCKYSPVSLSVNARLIAFEAMIAECQFHGWSLYALNALSQHVHALITVPCGVKGGYVIARLKAAASRELHAAGFFKDQPIWTKGGNPGEIKTSGYFYRVYDYVLNSQTDKPLSIPS